MFFFHFYLYNVKIYIKLYWFLFIIKKKMYKLLKNNKFISAIIIIIISLLAYEWYVASAKNKNIFDTTAYVQAIKWFWFIERDDEKIMISEKTDKKEIFSWDIIKTINDSSVLLISWWDWSITRLWWKSELLVNNLNISPDLTKIQVDFDLNSWKTWSNVVTSIWEDSYFNENFSTYVAWVRWTVFEVNLDSDYLYVSEHEVELKNKTNNKTYDIKEWETFSTTLLQYIDWKARDAIRWVLNENLDKEYIKELSEKTVLYFNKIKDTPKSLTDFVKSNNIYNKISSWELSELKDNLTDKTYEEAYSAYQKLNFLKPGEDWYDLKSWLMEILLSKKSENNDTIERNVAYDLDYSIKEWDSTSLNKIILLLKDNNIDISNYKDIFSNLPVDLKWISEDVKTVLYDNLDSLESLTWITKESVIEWFESWKDKITDIIKWTSIGNLIKQ